MTEEEIQELMQIIETLPWGIEQQVTELLLKALHYADRLQDWPLPFKSMVANSIGHQFVWIFKKAKKDSAIARVFFKERLIVLFDLPADWLPKWPLVPPA